MAITKTHGIASVPVSKAPSFTKSQGIISVPKGTSNPDMEMPNKFGIIEEKMGEL